VSQAIYQHGANEKSFERKAPSRASHEKEGGRRREGGRETSGTKVLSCDKESSSWHFSSLNWNRLFTNVFNRFQLPQRIAHNDLIAPPPFTIDQQ
jgi:hypothetical protein